MFNHIIMPKKKAKQMKPINHSKGIGTMQHDVQAAIDVHKKVNPKDVFDFKAEPIVKLKSKVSSKKNVKQKKSL